MICAVVDTNVIVSAALTHNPDSPTVKVLNGLFLKEYAILYNEEILYEYETVLSRSKFNISAEEIKNLLAFIRDYGIPSERFPYGEAMPDEKDRVFYEITLSREDSFLVTGNLKHFPREPRVVTPAEMLEILESGR